MSNVISSGRGVSAQRGDVCLGGVCQGGGCLPRGGCNIFTSNYSQKKSENVLSSNGKTRNKNYQSTPKLYCRCTVIANVPATWSNLGYVNQIVR